MIEKFKSYIDSYSLRLAEHKAQYEDNDELSFVVNEIQRISNRLFVLSDEETSEANNEKTSLTKIVRYLLKRQTILQSPNPQTASLYLTGKTIQNPAQEVRTSTTEVINPFPRIFTSKRAFEKFKQLQLKFGDTKYNMANYSYVYHRMKRENLIFDSNKHNEFIHFLHQEFDIYIERIKPWSQIGKKTDRGLIYNEITNK